MRGFRKARAGADPGPAPSRDVLHEAALGYLARCSATAATLTRVLDRRIATWARRAARAAIDPDIIARDAAQSKETVPAILARLGDVGLVDDAAYAESRARSLSCAGRSRRAISAHLAAKGVDPETARQALPDDADVELAAALAFAKKRRIGPFTREEEGRSVTREQRQKALAAMARAGFGFSTCERALGMDREEAEARLHARLTS